MQSIFCLWINLSTGVWCSPHAVGPFLTSLGSAHSKLSLSVNRSTVHSVNLFLIFRHTFKIHNRWKQIHACSQCNPTCVSWPPHRCCTWRWIWDDCLERRCFPENWLCWRYGRCRDDVRVRTGPSRTRQVPLKQPLPEDYLSSCVNEPVKSKKKRRMRGGEKEEEADRDLQWVSLMILPPKEEDRFMMHDIVSNIHLVFIWGRPGGWGGFPPRLPPPSLLLLQKSPFHHSWGRGGIFGEFDDESVDDFLQSWFYLWGRLCT